MDTLPTTIAELQALVRQLWAENAALKAELADLKARLQADSHNSHQPPSSDGVRKRPPRPALPKLPGCKPGGQPGHQGKTLTMVSDPTRTIRCAPQVCSCGASLQDIPGRVLERRQVFDLPQPTIHVTEYQRIRCQCRVCGLSQEGTFPSSVSAPTQYGSSVSALATLFNTAYKLPFKAIRQVFHDLFGMPVNEGTLIRANATCYDALAPSEQRLKAQVQAAPVCHVDETGLRVGGQLHWQHVASTASATYLFHHPKRGRQALESECSLLPSYHGWVIHDCWSSYFRFSTCRHGLCGAHLLRELTAVAEQGRRWAALMHRFLMALYRHSQKGTGTVRYVDRWQQGFERICAFAQREEPPPFRRHQKGQLTRTRGRNLLERLIRHKAAVLAFALHQEVPFTNNQAERDLRHVKVKQKIAGSFRTSTGADHYARIMSFISTARKQHRHVFKELCQVFQGKSFLCQPACAK